MVQLGEVSVERSRDVPTRTCSAQCTNGSQRGGTRPSGMIADHLIEVFGRTQWSTGPQSWCFVAIRCGWMILQKPDGSVWGIVVGDVFRRAVARMIAQQYVAKVEVATIPHQYVLRTKAGCETVAHILQVLTDLDPNATVVSVDGIRPISRNSMMRVRHMADGEMANLLPICGRMIQ